MAKEDLDISKFSNHLFWDVDKSSLDGDKDKVYIIRQVIEYGFLADWMILQNHYGLDTIVSVAKELRYLDSKSLSFISTIAGEPEESFRCYKLKQSMPQHWI